MRPRVLLLGRAGQVSSYLQAALDVCYEVEVLGSDALDLSDTESIEPALAATKADIIVNPAAYTAVDLAEENKETAERINHVAVAKIATYCRQQDLPLIHYSTDYVFDGKSKRPYKETDATNPQGVYGMSKLRGEKAILASDCKALILRTSWVYSNVGANFYKTMLRLAADRTQLSVVDDQIGAPTFAGSIASASKQLIDALLLSRSPQYGVYHLSNQGETSWCGFAKRIFALHGIEMDLSPITTAEYPTAAARPAYSVLDNQKLAKEFSLVLPHWQKALETCVQEVATAASSA